MIQTADVGGIVENVNMLIAEPRHLFQPRSNRSTPHCHLLVFRQLYTFPISHLFLTTFTRFRTLLLISTAFTHFYLLSPIFKSLRVFFHFFHLLLSLFFARD